MSDQPKPTTGCTCDNASGLHWGKCPLNMNPKPTTGTPCHITGPSSRICEHGTKSCEVQDTKPTTEWTEGKVFAYFESEDFKGLADAINAELEIAVADFISKSNYGAMIRENQQLREQLADVTSAAQMAVGAEKRKLAAALAALKQIRDKTDNRASSRAIAHVALEGDTTALDAAIAAAQKPLVDAIEKALTMQIGSPRDVLKNALAKVKAEK